MALCERCSDSLLLAFKETGKEESSDRNVPHHKSLSSWKYLVAQYCKICATYWQEVPESLRDGLANAQHSDACQMTVIESDSRLRTIFGSTGSGYDGVIALKLSCTCSEGAKAWDPKDSLSSLQIHRMRPTRGNTSPKSDQPFGDSTGSPESMAKIREWLSICDSDHSKCRGEQPIWYPMRLLDLHRAAREGLCRLRVTREEPPDGPYGTLSHCWGSKTFMRLTTSNMARFKESIEVSAMTKTFQEAIYVCTQLGLNYLWIDSLYIVQDSKDAEDWLAESEMMDKIYAHGLFNIAATDSKDGDGGLFREREGEVVKPAYWTPPHRKVPWPHHIGPSYWTRRGDYYDDDRCIIENAWTWTRTHERSPLLRRGWVFQERLHAKRLIHFGDPEIIWECSEITACESSPRYIGMPRLARNSWSDYGHHFKSLTLPENDYSTWWRLQSAYSGLRLTFLDDKPLAIAGAAKRWEPILQDTYTAGMWHSRLCSELLLWHVDGHSESLDLSGMPTGLPARKYHVPSFSWLSLAAPITPWGVYKSNATYLFGIVDLQLEHVTNDHTGLLRSSKLVIPGELCSIESRPAADGDGWEPFDSVDLDERVVRQMHAEPDYSRGNLPAVALPNKAPGQSGDAQHFFLRAAKWNDSGSKRREFYCCLILELVEAVPETYRRIGFVDGSGPLHIVFNLRGNFVLYEAVGRKLVRLLGSIAMGLMFAGDSRCNEDIIAGWIRRYLQSSVQLTVLWEPKASSIVQNIDGGLTTMELSD